MSSKVLSTSCECLFLTTPNAARLRVGFLRTSLPQRRPQQHVVKRHQVTATAALTRPRSATRARDCVKRKVALVIGYDGATYHGLQRNKDVVTVSDVLEDAFYSVGAISDDNVGHLEKIKWQTAARTDRGVCAAGNVISAKLLFNKEEQIAGNAFQMTKARINNALPDHMRVFGIQSITGSFSARINCDARWYEYLLPVSALPKGTSLDEFEEVLKVFEGTHPFHNYTVGQDHSIPPRRQSMRYLTEVRCDKTPVCLDGDYASQEWVRIRVKGQSFMLHQIRKMVSMAVLTCHGRVPHDAIGRSFSQQVLIDVPPAPAIGLFLDCCRFESYNERHKMSLDQPLILDEFEQAREEFKMRYIIPSIARRSMEEDALEIYFKTAEAHPPRF